MAGLGPLTLLDSSLKVLTDLATLRGPTCQVSSRQEAGMMGRGSQRVCSRVGSTWGGQPGWQWFGSHQASCSMPGAVASCLPLNPTVA